MSRLRVALDGRLLQSERLGGVGRYLTGLIPHLSERADLYLLLDRHKADPDESLRESAQMVRLGGPVPVPGLAWLEVSVTPWLRRFGGVFHATFNTRPLSYFGRSVLTLHDLATQLHPEDFRGAKRVAWRLYVRSSVSRADVVTTVSRFVKGQITEYFGIDESRVLVAPDALDPIFGPDRAAGAEPLAQRLGIEPPYMVAIGGAPRRGLPVAVEAWRRVSRRLESPVALVIAGGFANAPEPGIVSPGFLEDEDWATLLAGAQALCYPTRYEGFGLPALEAAASGTPVVCARIASLPEVLGDAGCWAADPTAEAITDVLERVLSDREYHAERRAAGLERARQSPDFATVAHTMLEAYTRAAG